MKSSVKLLSNEGRILGRIISGGSQASPKHQLGRSLASAIANGFFEKKTVEGIQVARSLSLSFTLFNILRETPSN